MFPVVVFISIFPISFIDNITDTIHQKVLDLV